MVSYQQLMSCQPQKFTQAGQTYRRMAEGFGKVEGIFKQANQIISGTADWSSVAQQAAMQRATRLGKGLQAGGQETNAAGTALTTFGTALTAAQTALRAAVAEAMTGPLIITPDGQTIIPPWAYSWPACVEELPRLQALKAVVDVQIRAALTAATAADMTAAGTIGALAVGQLIKDFGSGHASTSTNQTDPNATMNQASLLPASYQPNQAATAPDTGSDVQGLLAATTGAGTDGGQVDRGVSTADWRGMSADGTNPDDTRVAQANADGGRQVSGTIGTAAVGTGAGLAAANRHAGAAQFTQAQLAQAQVAQDTQAGAQQLPQQYQQYLAAVQTAAQAHNVDPALLFGIMDRESGGRNIIGDNGHGHGVMQIDDRSHGAWLRRHNNGLDPATSIDYGARVLAENIARFPNDLDAALAAYNAGPAAVNRALRDGRDVNSVTTGGDYARDVQTRAAAFRNMLPAQAPGAGARTQPVELNR